MGGKHPNMSLARNSDDDRLVARPHALDHTVNTTAQAQRDRLSRRAESAAGAGSVGGYVLSRPW
jgi:hypothetical protein